MLTSVQYKNVKSLRDTTLPLAPVTLLVGPNGAGKTTALDALRAAFSDQQPRDPQFSFERLRSFGVEERDTNARVEVVANSDLPQTGATAHVWGDAKQSRTAPEGSGPLVEWLKRIRLYALDAPVVAEPHQQTHNVRLGRAGEKFTLVLDHMRDQEPESFEALNRELALWYPEYDRILFDTNQDTQREFFLRTRKEISKSEERHKVPAAALSQGTLLSLALMTLPYMVDPPSLVMVEDIDAGLHPRMLRLVRDALFRLAYPPEDIDRAPVQVIATTHSPYLLDEFKDHLDHVVIASKTGLDVTFRRLSDYEHIDEILGDDPPLGEAWYTGIFGGVPAAR